MTYSTFFTSAYGWIGLWATLTFLIMLTRQGKSFADWEVLAFRGGVGIVCLSVFFRRIFDTVSVTGPSPWLTLMVLTHFILAVVVVPTFFRVLLHVIDSEKYYDNRPNKPED